MTKKIIRVLAIVISVVMAIVGIGIWHHRASKDEPVWREGKEAVHWDRDRIPLRVCPTNSLVGYKSSLKSAIKTFNAYAGFKIVGRADSDCDITVSMGSIQVGGEDDFAIAELSPDKGLGQTCVVTLNVPGDIRQVMFAFMHEFTHCVGLAHDPFTASIANINAPSFSDSSPPPRLTDKDVAALKERYK